MAARIWSLKHRDVGKIECLVPFFDLQSEGGLFPLVNDALDILTRKVNGEWILFELGSLESMVASKWFVNSRTGFIFNDHDNSDRYLSSIFPVLTSLESSLSSEAWAGGVARRLSIALLLIEGVALFVDDFGGNASEKKAAAEKLANRVIWNFQQRDDPKEAYSLSAGLSHSCRAFGTRYPRSPT